MKEYGRSTQDKASAVHKSSAERIDRAVKRQKPVNDDWISLCEASRQSGYDKGRLSVLAKEKKIRSKPGFIEVVQKQRVVLVKLSDVLKHREHTKPGPKPTPRRAVRTPTQ